MSQSQFSLESLVEGRNLLSKKQIREAADERNSLTLRLISDLLEPIIQISGKWSRQRNETIAFRGGLHAGKMP